MTQRKGVILLIYFIKIKSHHFRSLLKSTQLVVCNSALHSCYLLVSTPPASSSSGDALGMAGEQIMCEIWSKICFISKKKYVAV